MQELARLLTEGDPVALARAISLVEAGTERGEAILAETFGRTGRASVRSASKTACGATGACAFAFAKSISKCLALAGSWRYRFACNNSAGEAEPRSGPKPGADGG